jgi:formylglycine-generating enzyme required for sulfatase activity
MDTSGTIEVAAGPFAMGSSLHERAAAIDALAELGGDPRDAVERLRGELPQRLARTDAFAIMAMPVTQAEYGHYVYDAGVPEPWVDRTTWARTHSGDSPSDVERFAWTNGRPQLRRSDHPAVLVSQQEAEAYCAWWGERRGGRGRLPSEAEWEKTARGADGRAYPWGSRFHPDLANTRESGRGDTESIGRNPAAASPHGALDMAGNVLEWTASASQDGRVIVKGGGWKGDAIAARCAARSSRPPSLRDVTIGFRCVLEPR